MKTTLSEDMAEVLEAVWTLEEKGSTTLDGLVSKSATQVTDELLRRLEDRNLLSLNSPNELRARRLP